jgi:hypothetical protein
MLSDALVQNQLLTLLWHVPPSECMLSDAFDAKSAADPVVALFHHQWVCYLVLLVQNQLLTLLWHCSTFRMYVIWCFWCKISC